MSVLLLAALLAPHCALRPAPAVQDLTSEQVKASLARGMAYLASQQISNGSFLTAGLGRGRVSGRADCLGDAVPAQRGHGSRTIRSIRRALNYLRNYREPGGTYETSLMIMALVAAKEWDRDKLRIASLAQKLEDMQTTHGVNAGMWNYGHGQLGGGHEDNSNTQFAILGLREAAIAGVKIRRRTWELASEHFIETQNDDGGWGYHAIDRNSTGSMTCSGIGCLVICDQMLGSSGDDLNADGTPKCCNARPARNRALRRGVQWLSRVLSPSASIRGTAPRGCSITYTAWNGPGGSRGSGFSACTTGIAKGPSWLLEGQTLHDGSWNATFTAIETDKVVATSFALLFLSKGLAPVLINKLNYGPAGRGADASTTRRFPIGTSIPTTSATSPNSPAACRSGPSCSPTRRSISTRFWLKEASATCCRPRSSISAACDDPKFTDAQVQLLRSYVEQGGFIFAVNNCNGAGFDEGIRSLASRIYASGEAQLKRLPPEHPIYPGRVSPRSRGGRIVGGRLRLPHVVRLFAAGPFLLVGQVVVSTGPQADAAV